MAVIDQGTASVIGAALVLAGTIYSVSRADRKGKQEAEHAKAAEQEQAQQVQATSFHDNLALTQYIRDQVREGVAAETAGLRRELRDVRLVLGNIYGRLEKIKEAVREYIRQVREQWGKHEQPPAVTGHLADLLADVDEDTWTAAKIAELTTKRHDDEPPDDYGT